MITSFNPAVPRVRMAANNNSNNRALNFGDKLSTKEINAIKEGKTSIINTIFGRISAGVLTPEDNRGVMEQITKEKGGDIAVHKINKLFGFQFPK